MKLWDKGITLDAKIEKFTTEKDRMLDVYLAKWDILGSLAHITMLESIGLLTSAELLTLREGLLDILENNVEKGGFQIEEGIEDVHSQIELMLTRSCGEAGKKIHSGRSRNDQVLVDLKLYFRDEIKQISGLVKALFTSLQAKSEQYKE
ncbi:MAG: lyase family protein, partial [Cyclobacteriaceae bacterium]|nr:lyase family protein [Cyclobacteriaceae bacterium]